MAAGALFVGCGSDEEFANKPRPPATAQLSVRVDNRAVEVAPTKIGAGMAIFTISNQSDEDTALRFIGPTRRSTDEIAAGESANIQVKLKSGEYEIEPSAEVIEATTLLVGAPRKSGKNMLQLP